MSLQIGGLLWKNLSLHSMLLIHLCHCLLRKVVETSAKQDTRYQRPRRTTDLDDVWKVTLLTLSTSTAEQQTQMRGSTSSPVSLTVNAPSITIQQRVQSEIAFYRAILYKDTNSIHKSDQLLFWSQMESQLPLLSEYSFFVLTAQASEAKAERLFSGAGRILIPTRAG
jgi:hypothetical protein